MEQQKSVHIYAETNSTTPVCIKRRGSYVLECIRKNGETATREAFMEIEGTYHAAILQLLICAMQRINQPCQICFHTQDAYVLNMADKFLKTWSENGFRNSKGVPVKNAEEWEQLWQQVKKHEIVIKHGTHSYYKWMQEQMAKKEKETEKKSEDKSNQEKVDQL